MPHTTTSILDKVLDYTATAANALQDVTDATQMPFLGTVSSLSLTIIPIVQNVKVQKDWCLRMVEYIHQILCALAALCTDSVKIRSPKMLGHIAQYADTLQKFHSCLRAQQNLGTIKRFLKQSQITAEMDRCEKELIAALKIFTLKDGVKVASALVEFNIDTEERHQELLELISSRSRSFDAASSLKGSSLNTSSGSLSLLPSSPKIFHGRESELKHLIISLLADASRESILGPGGMGKTTLAMAALHHPAIVEKYTVRHFISCESAQNCSELVNTIGLHLGLGPSRQLLKLIIHHFQQCGPCLVVLDNFETPWEPVEFRGSVEEFISLLADIPTLALLITMRGAERPGKVKWNRPFLPPLEPLTAAASRQIFTEVADEPSSEEESALNTLLHLSGSLPLAISLMASIASFEGYVGTLARWQIENTSLLSDGHEKRSNLEKSITLSLGSPRISSSPHAMNLISLLSLLPDGIRAEDIMTSQVPIPDVRALQSLLVRTSLAYIDAQGRLKTLSPVREFVRRVHPPSPSISRPLRTYFEDLLEIWAATKHLSAGNISLDLAAYVGNMNELILYGVSTETGAARIRIGQNIIHLDHFSKVMLLGSSPLFQRIPHIIEATGDPALRWRYTAICFGNLEKQILIKNPDTVIREGFQYFKTGTHSPKEAVDFHNALARYYTCPTSFDFDKATKVNETAMAFAQQAHDIDLQVLCLETEHNLALSTKDPDRVMKVVDKARRIGRLPSNSSFWEYVWSTWEAWLNCLVGDMSRALAFCMEAHEALTSMGLKGSDLYLRLLDMQADFHNRKSEYLEAQYLHADILSKTSPIRSPWYHANSLCAMVHLGILTERKVTDIRANLDAAEAVYAALGRPREVACSWVAAELDLYRGDIIKSRAAFKAVLSRRGWTPPEILQECLAALADPKHGMHGASDTFRWALIYLAFVQKLKDPVGTSQALRCLADLYTTLGDEETALNVYHAGLQGGTTMDIHRLRAQCMVGIGEILIRRGDSIHAKEMLEGSHPLFVRSSQLKEAAAVEKRLEQLQKSEIRHPSSTLVLHDADVGQATTTSPTVAHTVPNSETDHAVESRLGRLALLQAPSSSPASNVGTTMEPGASADGQTKLLVLD